MSELKMWVSLDGGQTYQEAGEGVRVRYEGVMIDDAGSGELEVKHSSEGIITDLSRLEADEVCIGTANHYLDDIVQDLVENG